MGLEAVQATNRLAAEAAQQGQMAMAAKVDIRITAVF